MSVLDKVEQELERYQTTNAIKYGFCVLRIEELKELLTKAIAYDEYWNRDTEQPSDAWDFLDDLHKKRI